MRGLIAPLERKNGWTLAEEAWHAGPDRVHRLLNRIDWDADEILDDLREKVVEHLGGPEAVLIVDDTGFLKKRVRSAWVQRQWAQSKVDEITPIQYDAFRKYGQAKYSHNYANVILGIFKMLMDDAVVKYKYREESPIVEQKRRCLYKKKQVRRAKRQLSIRSVHQAAQNAYYVWGFAGWTYIWTIAFTGLRPPSCARRPSSGTSPCTLCESNARPTGPTARQCWLRRSTTVGGRSSFRRSCTRCTRSFWRRTTSRGCSCRCRASPC